MLLLAWLSNYIQYRLTRVKRDTNKRFRVVQLSHRSQGRKQLAIPLAQIKSCPPNPVEESNQAAPKSQLLTKSHGPNRNWHRIPNRNPRTTTPKHSKSHAHAKIASRIRAETETPWPRQTRASTRSPQDEPIPGAPPAQCEEGGRRDWSSSTGAADLPWSGPGRLQREERRIRRGASRGGAGGGIWGAAPARSG